MWFAGQLQMRKCCCKVAAQSALSIGYTPSSADPSLGSVMDALNPARNRGSVAHPNDNLLDADEAMLFINAARTVLQYVDAKLA
jgi:abortive infection Abi-like protein